MELEDSVVLETGIKVGSGGGLGTLNISSIIIRVKTYWFSFCICVVMLVDSIFLNAFWWILVAVSFYLSLFLKLEKSALFSSIWLVLEDKQQVQTQVQICKL